MATQKHSELKPYVNNHQKEGVMKGSCLCGNCVFELKGRISAVGKCHCSKCRKVSGTGSNAVHWAKLDNVEWISGTENIKEYSRNDGWRTAFCSNCGSPLPATDDNKTMWFVPAGLLVPSDLPCSAWVVVVVRYLGSAIRRNRAITLAVRPAAGLNIFSASNCGRPVYLTRPPKGA